MLRLGLIAVAVLRARCVAAQGGSCTASGDCHSSRCSLNKCICNPGFSGEHCEHNVCEGNNVCHGHGSCTIVSGSSDCTCTGGWTGSGCQVDPCKDYDCGQGRCHGNKQCTCNSGWQGNQCKARRPCNGFSPPANSHGCEGKYVFEETCVAKCNDGYTAGTHQKTFRCEASGHMSGGDLACERESH